MLKKGVHGGLNVLGCREVYSMNSVRKPGITVANRDIKGEALGYSVQKEGSRCVPGAVG